MAEPDSQCGDYERWVHAHGAELYRFAYRLSGKEQVAEDLVQETFTEAWRSLLARRKPDQPRAWLFQILRFRYAHFIRDQRHHLNTSHDTDALDENIAPQQPHPLDRLANQESLERAFAVLSPSVRETFLLVFQAQLTCREAAEELHIPLGTVLSRIDRARRILRTALASKDAAPEAGPSKVPNGDPITP